MIAGFAGRDRVRKVIRSDALAILEKTPTPVARIVRHTAELIGPVYQRI
jgi:1-aminocyclopropane-1-carboxylate deaminase